MIKHPSKLFITYLVFMGKTLNETIDLLAEYGLPAIPEEFQLLYYDSIKAELENKTIASFKPGKPLDDFASKHKITYLVHPDKVLASCTKLLDNRSCKSDLYMSLIGRIELEEIVEHVNHTYEMDVSEAVVKAFKHYYFNVDHMSHADWVHIFPVIDGADEASLMSCLVGGATTAAYRLGMEQNVTIREAVQEAVTAIYATLREVRSWPATPQKVKVLSDAVASLSKAHTVINTADQELASVAKELRQFKLEKSADRTISLKALTKGNYSGSKRKKAAL